MKHSRVLVDGKALESGLPDARAVVAALDFPQLLLEIDAGSFGNTALNLRALEELSAAAAVASAAARALPPGAPAGYLAFVFAEECAARLAALGPVDDPRAAAALPLAQYQDLSQSPLDSVVPLVLRDCAHFLRYYIEHPEPDARPRRDEDSLRCLHSYFRLLSRAAATLSGEVAIDVQTPSLRARGLTIARPEEPTSLLPISFDDLVGNEDLIKAGRRLAQDVAGFDLKTGKNPRAIRNQILFALGSPGCGKTATAHAIGRYFLELCEKGGLPARVRVIRRTDWASAYQNQSAKTLLDLFQNEVFDAPGVCGVYWPDIDTAFAARGDSDIRQEEKNILGTLFGILDGTIGPKNGRWFMICDANTVNMDAAALSRISQNPIKVYGPQTPEQYVRLLRAIKLRGKDQWLPIKDERWDAIGKRCADAKLSGRAIEHVAGRVLTAIEDFDQPESYYSLSFDEKKKMIEQLSRPVDAESIERFIEDFVTFEREAQEKGERERFIDRVKEIRLHLSAQRAAAGLRVDPKGHDPRED